MIQRKPAYTNPCISEPSTPYRLGCLNVETMHRSRPTLILVRQPLTPQERVKDVQVQISTHRCSIRKNRCILRASDAHQVLDVVSCHQIARIEPAFELINNLLRTRPLRHRNSRTAMIRPVLVRARISRDRANLLDQLRSCFVLYMQGFFLLGFFTRPSRTTTRNGKKTGHQPLHHHNPPVFRQSSKQMNVPQEHTI